MSQTSPTSRQDTPPDFYAPYSLKVLAVLAFFCALYFAKLIVLPILVAGFIALFASPLVRGLMTLYIPRAIASLIVVAGIVTLFGYLFSLLLDPAIRWMEAAPIIGDRLMFELENSQIPMPTQSGDNSDGASPINKAMDSTLTTLTSAFTQSTLVFFAQITVIIIITYFFLTYGDELMRSIVRAQNNFGDKKLAVVLFQSIRDDISMYILVISLINITLGLATAGVLSLIDFKDALLWGALASILNFAPYVGPLLLSVILTAVGFAGGEPLQKVFIAPGLFLIVNFIESQFVTPTILGKRFNINPLLVVLWMLFWGWLWGPVGMLISIPILMCFKLASAHLNLIGDWVELFNGMSAEHHQAPCKKNPLFAIFTKK